MGQISFVDTTLRDGHHSLWAMGMRTGMMVPVASKMDEAGFRAIEVFGGGHFRKCIRELKENPWERIRLVAEQVKSTPLAFMMLPSVSVFDVTPYSVLKVYIERLVAHGIGRIQIIESSNDFKNRIPQVLKMINSHGLQTIIGLVYSISPKHTDEYYAAKTAHAASLNPTAIFIKDPSGLMTPERVKTLVPAVLSHARKVPVEFHGHCSTGLMPVCYVEAMKQGIEIFHTALPPLANSSSQPSIFNIAKNARILGFNSTINLESLENVSKHFLEIAERENLPIGVPTEYDVSQYVHHVPGGVISHLKHQLTEMGVVDRFDEVLDEIGRVRAELGYPIMVTPFSQFVCTQATLNVITGIRYKQIPDEIIQLVTGHWGESAVEDVDPEIKDKISDSPRAKFFKSLKQKEPEISEIRARLGGPNLSDDDLILRYIAPQTEIDGMYGAGPAKMYETGKSSMAHLMSELLKRDQFHYISLQSKTGSMTFNSSSGNA